MLAFSWTSPSFALVWFGITCLIALLWLKRHIDVARGQGEPVLSDDDALTPPDQLPALSMLVAGKDEEENIERCVRGLEAQDYPNLQLIAANDRSSDRTGAILDGLGAQFANLTVVHVRELPAGWFGKNNAMREAVERATGEWLCFTDADCTFDSRKLLSAAVSFAIRNDIEFLSVLPKMEAETFWEQIVQPVAGAIMLYWTPPDKVNDPKQPHAYANGAFMLMKRSAYERIGRHEAFKAVLNEDMYFARAAKREGVKFRVIRGGDMYRVRMYTGWTSIWRGWSRIFYGCFGTPRKLIRSLLLLLVASLSPYLTLVLSPLGGEAAMPLALAGTAAIVAQQSIMWRFYHLSGMRRSWALTYPIGAVVCLGILVNSLKRALSGGRTTWRGTTYQGGS